jgi:hypothetical protein
MSVLTNARPQVERAVNEAMGSLTRRTYFTERQANLIRESLHFIYLTGAIEAVKAVRAEVATQRPARRQAL